MPRKPKQEPERRVIEDFSQAVKIDKDTMARLVEFVFKGKFKGYTIGFGLGVLLLFSFTYLIYYYFFR